MFEATYAEVIEPLRAAGLTQEITDPTMLKFHVELAKGVGALTTEIKMRKCGICNREHQIGERCPNSAGRYLRAPDV